MKVLTTAAIVCVLLGTDHWGAICRRIATRRNGPMQELGSLAQPAGAPPTPVHTGIKELVKSIGRDFVALPSKENLYWTLGGGAAALAVHPADDYIQEHVVGNSTADAFFAPGRIIGIVVPLAGSVGTYAWGRLRRFDRRSRTLARIDPGAGRGAGPDAGLEVHDRSGSGLMGLAPLHFHRAMPRRYICVCDRLERHLGGATQRRPSQGRSTSRRHACRPIAIGSAMRCSAPQSASSRGAR